uniref:Acyltransferase required for palmitoylation of hedgehog hh family of secreted signaling n=1 Tax=Amblyomma maculatum TaxID=34609 RepID=G3ML86_AMBMU
MDAGMSAPVMEKGQHVSAKKVSDNGRWRFDLEKVVYWTVSFAAVFYGLWKFATNERNAGLLREMKHGFAPSPYGLRNLQDMTNWGWRTTKFVLYEAWKWYLLHPVLARATAFYAPSLLPVFYATYSSIFVAWLFGWEVLILFLGQHAAFYVITWFRKPILCYVLAFAMHFQKFVSPFNGLEYMHPRYGLMPYRAAYVTFHWNLMRGISFSMDFISTQRSETDESRRRKWPPYWETLAYSLYLPTIYTGPPQNYDYFLTQMNKPRPSCTLLEIATCIARLLRSGAHFLLMELMSHYLYSSAMSKWPIVVATMDLPSVLGLALSLLFTFYVRYLFTYGFPGALGRAEGFDVPPRAKCIARMSRCSFFWRHFDRGMHLWIRRYVYIPAVGEGRHPVRMVIGTAVAFGFTWAWHSMMKADAIWCSLSVLGIAQEVLLVEIRKWQPIKKFEGLYLASAHRMRVAAAVLGAPHFMLTICACLFHLAEIDTVLVICRRATGFPLPLLPIMVLLYCGCQTSMDAAEWDASASARRKQASS